MKIRIDVNEHRDALKSMNPHCDFDSNFIFYYDESNNPRKVHIENGVFNSPHNKNFILGGIVTKSTFPDFTNLSNRLKLQKTVNEVKFKHIAQGDFFSCLNSQKLNTFLKFFLDEDISIHFYSVNILYFGLVDIIESIIPDEHINYHFLLKNILYKLVKIDVDSVIPILRKYAYPNIKKDKFSDFSKEFLDIVLTRKIDPQFNYIVDIIKSSLTKSAKMQTLQFITNEKDHTLIDNFFHFYQDRITTFINSNHTFDHELKIEEKFNEIEFLDGKNILSNYTFLDSPNEVKIQVSDVICGIIGKLYEFVNNIDIDNLFNSLENFNTLQKENIVSLFQLIQKSENKNPAFIHIFQSLDDITIIRNIHEWTKTVDNNI